MSFAGILSLLKLALFFCDTNIHTAIILTAKRMLFYDSSVIIKSKTLRPDVVCRLVTYPGDESGKIFLSEAAT